MGNEAPAGCKDYAAYRANPRQECVDWYDAQRPDWVILNEVPWTRIAMEIVAFFVL